MDLDKSTYAVRLKLYDRKDKIDFDNLVDCIRYCSQNLSVISIQLAKFELKRNGNDISLAIREHSLKWMVTAANKAIIELINT